MRWLNLAVTIATVVLLTFTLRAQRVISRKMDSLSQEHAATPTKTQANTTAPNADSYVIESTDILSIDVPGTSLSQRGLEKNGRCCLSTGLESEMGSRRQTTHWSQTTACTSLPSNTNDPAPHNVGAGAVVTQCVPAILGRS
jgi:hypothetical protein